MVNDYYEIDGQWNDEFKSSLMLSIAIHVFFLLGFVVFSWMLKSEKDNSIEVIKSSVRVDVVGMPKFTIQELRQMQKESGQSTITSDVKEDVKIEKNDIVIEKKATKIDLSGMLKKYSEQDSIDTSKKAKKKKRIDLSKVIYEGNQVSSGSSLTGDASEGDLTPFHEYVQKIPDFVRPYWKLPSFLLEQELTCRVRIFINSAGRVIKMELYESSGNSDYDNRALDAIKAAMPLPAPEQGAVANRLVSNGVILGFPL